MGPRWKWHHGSSDRLNSVTEFIFNREMQCVEWCSLHLPVIQSTKALLDAMLHRMEVSGLRAPITPGPH